MKTRFSGERVFAYKMLHKGKSRM